MGSQPQGQTFGEIGLLLDLSLGRMAMEGAGALEQG